jgi:hypothetical protein
MKTEHKIYMYTEGGRDYWECSCGMAGSCREGDGDLASDRHIGDDEMRIDVNKPLQ